MKESKNNKVYTPKKVQLICPNCKYEFSYNKSALDKRINYLGQLIFEKMSLISKLKKIPNEDRNDKEIKRLEKEKEKYTLMVSDLKQKREILKSNEDRANFYNLKEIIKEFYGEKEYLRCIDEMLRRSEAYEIKDLSKIGFYSSSTGTPIRKV